MDTTDKHRQMPVIGWKDSPRFHSQTFLGPHQTFSPDSSTHDVDNGWCSKNIPLSSRWRHRNLEISFSRSRGRLALGDWNGDWKTSPLTFLSLLLCFVPSSGRRKASGRKWKAVECCFLSGLCSLFIMRCLLPRCRVALAWDSSKRRRFDEDEFNEGPKTRLKSFRNKIIRDNFQLSFALQYPHPHTYAVSLSRRERHFSAKFPLSTSSTGRIRPRQRRTLLTPFFPTATETQYVGEASSG